MAKFVLFVLFMSFKIKIKVDPEEKEIMCALLKALLSGISSLAAQASLVEASYITYIGCLNFLLLSVFYVLQSIVTK